MGTIGPYLGLSYNLNTAALFKLSINKLFLYENHPICVLCTELKSLNSNDGPEPLTEP